MIREDLTTIASECAKLNSFYNCRAACNCKNCEYNVFSYGGTAELYEAEQIRFTNKQEALRKAKIEQTGAALAPLLYILGIVITVMLIFKSCVG
jgi:hypothetical protein